MACRLTDSAFLFKGPHQRKVGQIISTQNLPGICYLKWERPLQKGVRSKKCSFSTKRVAVVQAISTPVAPFPADTNTAEYREQLCERRGFRQMGKPVPDNVTLKDIITSLLWCINNFPYLFIFNLMEPSSIRKQPQTPRSSIPIITSPTMILQLKPMKRRSSMAASVILMLTSLIQYPATALSFPNFNINMVAEEQTIEEAMTNIRDDAESLLSVKSLIEIESWGETQRSLRKSSALLKQDVYTVIQSKPGKERSLLRKLYSELFNGVTKLDYAARDGDRTRVEECYARISATLNEILSRV